jgi:hypothetical protein
MSDPVVTTPVETPANTLPDAPPAVDWAAQIPQDLAQEKMWEPLKGKPLGDVLKGYAEAQRFIGGSVRLPTDKDKPEERSKKLNDLYGKLGRPESPDKYPIKTPELPNGLTLQESQLKGFLAKAHAANMTPEQVQASIDFYAEHVKGQATQLQESRTQGEAALQQEWGANYKNNLALAHRGLATFADKVLGSDGKVLLDELDASGFGNNPRLVKLFAALGKEMQEDGLVTGDSDVSVEALEASMAELTKPGTPFWDKFHPEHDAAVSKVNKLREQIGNPLLAR